LFLSDYPRSFLKPPQALLVSGFSAAPGSAGFGHSVSVGRPLFPGISAAPSTVTTSAPLCGTARCNTAGGLGGDENAARSLSADTAAAAAVAFVGQPLDFRDSL